ncbi:thioredoxin domain-containing protein [[Phormidium ambiguum] IAM M-71]|uniref:Thioredoxin domain-containing protein n=1 Tax=[Phormidium ambiguum] IAM M-71 TaxID=454136 RepID=A0A1U7IA52_9CYAN|nr:thioredoxin domain-containing protein [Phormidium ambiguum]OKH33349.1 thioredoxin domain-containing protein [Phormidium ambiguum IAM M-71]
MTNRLAQSPSLYLRKHAENPINWWPWCDEALQAAREENKPIFLSIGYSSCHWCTVMEGEAFSDLSIAEYMNDNFIAIKVDREERPDIDSIYMQSLQMMIGQGGWPLNIFLDSDTLAPFYGGTYFPVEPRYGRAGFLQVLQAIRRHYDTEKAKVESVTSEILSYLQQSASMVSSTAVELGTGLLGKGLETNTGVLSHSGSGPNFPMIPYAEVALRSSRFNLAAKYPVKQLCTKRGLDLALGGIFDHVAGGFHRYTVDGTWTVPHFEKMLYDNGQIVEYLANLYALGVQEVVFERAISLTVQWLTREMTAPEGYFYAAQDADNFAEPEDLEPEEGNFYVWSYTELQHLLSPEELTEIQKYFTVTSEGNFEGNNVLQKRDPSPLTDNLESAFAKLFVVRYGATADAVKTFPPARNNQEAKTKNWPGRIPPVTDTKMIVAWNSLMISGLARAAAVFAEPSYLAPAIRAAKFILENQWVKERFHRVNYEGEVAVSAQSEDYALFIKALLDLHQATLGIAEENAKFWLEKAQKVQAEFDEFLWSVELGGYFNTASDASDNLLVRERSYIDNATPSANGIAIANLVRLALLTEDLTYLDRAEQALHAFSEIMNKSPSACPSLFTALDWYRNYTLIRTNNEELNFLNKQYLPTAVTILTDELPPGTVGLVCQGLSCTEPSKTHEHLWQKIQESLSRG